MPDRTPSENSVRPLLGGRSLVFVGMMGSGKSAIGRLVAARLDLAYRDSDQEICEAAAMSIPEIFETFGEAYFRRGEKRVIKRLLGEGHSVISLGGGAYLDPSTRVVIAQQAVSVWLKADIETLYRRVMRRPGTRPLLQQGDPRETLKQLLEEREPVYALADITVESGSQTKNQMAADVVDAVASFLANERS